MKKYYVITIVIMVMIFNDNALSQKISWLPDINKNDFLEASNINILLLQHNVEMSAMVCKYDGSILLQKFYFENNILKINDTEWLCSLTKVSTPFPKDFIELNLAFKLLKGEMSSAGIAVAFDFNNWSTDNYVMIPASVYNGNRNKIEHRGYCTGFEKEDFYNKDIPQITTELPQLSPSPGSISKIEVSSCNASTPAMCIYGSKPHIAGVIYFCVNDYRTHIGGGLYDYHTTRVHGVHDLNGQAKPSAAILRQMNCPIEVSGLNRDKENHIAITVVSSLGFPSYTLRGYQVYWSDSAKNYKIKGERQLITDLSPWKLFDVKMQNMYNNKGVLTIENPQGNVVFQKIINSTSPYF